MISLHFSDADHNLYVTPICVISLLRRRLIFLASAMSLVQELLHIVFELFLFHVRSHAYSILRLHCVALIQLNLISSQDGKVRIMTVVKTTVVT